MDAHRQTRALVDRQDRGLGLDLNRAAVRPGDLTGVDRQAHGVDRFDQVGRCAVGDEGIERAQREGDTLACRDQRLGGAGRERDGGVTYELVRPFVV